MPVSRPEATAAATPAHFHWRQTADAERVHAIHRSVLARTPAGMVRSDDLAHFRDHVESSGLTLGCFLDDGQMVAYGVIGLRSPVVQHLASLLGAEGQRFCVLDGAAALPEWRGCGLHQAAIEQRIAHASAIGRTLVGATVAPHNLRALRSMFRAGMEVRAFAQMYGGLARLVVQRDALLPAPAWQSERAVGVADHAAHQAALDAGLVGHACSQDESGAWRVAYGRPA